MMMNPLRVAGNLPIKMLVARQLPTNTHTQAHACTYTRTHTHLHTYTHAHAYTHIHTHAHTNEVLIPPGTCAKACMYSHKISVGSKISHGGEIFSHICLYHKI